MSRGGGSDLLKTDYCTMTMNERVRNLDENVSFFRTVAKVFIFYYLH